MWVVQALFAVFKLALKRLLSKVIIPKTKWPFEELYERVPYHGIIS